MKHRQHIANRLAGLLMRTFGGEAGSGLILIVAAIAALLLANSPLGNGYHALFHDRLAWTPVNRLTSLHHWINDAAMAVFFFVVGLEIKREVLDGELSSPARRRLPVIAAITGMAVPALVYLAIAGFNTELTRGWAIPAATDIAFALGVLALLGRRAPPSLRLFLLTVAIVDDLGAVMIIAVFYTSSLDLAWLTAAAAILVIMFAANRIGVKRAWFFVPLALVLWYCVLHSGVHATVAGVLAALTIPLHLDEHGDSLLLRMEHMLVPWNAFLIVPVFGFANAGVSLAGYGMEGLLSPLPLAIAVGLFMGKQAGILGAIAFADRLGLAARPAGATWPQLWGMAILCGIGFTMSLFIGALAFPAHPYLVEEAKLGVMVGSLLSALTGYAVLRLSATGGIPD